METKKAAPGRPVDQQTQAYPQEPTMPSPWRRIPPRPEHRKPGRPGLRDALGLLILALQDCALPPRQQRRAWQLVEKWLPEIVSAWLAGGAV
jgi:hypothetical protein